ncbi:MAG: hypothetical protein MJZ34_05820 [Paludibacteraceae bacterium]|nr:hypothetical protein [Paludibacteraceae bacterium]
MEDLIKDKLWGELEYQEVAWVGELNTPILNSDGNLTLVVQDANKEGILDSQREAYKIYLQNEEKYKSCVTDFLLDYYKWNNEYFMRSVSGIDETYHKDVVTAKQLFTTMTLWYLFICRDGSFGYAFGCCWDKENGIAVLLSESEPRVISRTQLENLHKLNDNTFSLLIHDNERYWTTWDELSFFDETIRVQVEVEGSVEDGVNNAQRKAYNDYLLHKTEHLRRLGNFLLPTYLGSKAEADEFIAAGQQVGVKDVMPSRLVIDKKGNYGWICYTQWDDSYLGILLSEKDIHIMEVNQLRDFAKEKKMKDEKCGYLFREHNFWSQTILHRFFKGEVNTMRVAILTYDKNPTDLQLQKLSEFFQYDNKFWEPMKDEMLKYYLKFYKDFENDLEIPEELTPENVNRENVVSILTFTTLYVDIFGRIAWLCESPTEEDGLAFEFTDGKVELIFQPEII